MKILHIIDHVGMGGAQTILKSIFEKEKNNTDIFYYALRNNKFKVEIYHPNSYSYKGYSKLNIKSLFELKKLIENQNIDILHCHLAKSMICGYLLKLLFFRNLKLIFHEHGRIFQNQRWYNYFIRKAQNKVDLYIAVSKATKKRLIENAGIKESKIKVLYNFVDLNHFDSQKVEINRLEEREKLGLNDDDFILGFAGRHVERKGCRNLIFALGKLKHFKNIKLLIAGDGHKKEEYMKLVNKLGLDRNIFFLGFVPDIRWLYSIIDCFVVPSQWEPLGIVALEAHAMGVPVIATNVEGLNEIISDKKTGLLFEPENEKDLAEKINLIHADEYQRSEYIKKGLENIKNHSLENYLIDVEGIYNELF